jgi:hypothetical protein
MDNEDAQNEDAQRGRKRNLVNRTLVSSLPAHFGAALRLLRRRGSVAARSAAEVCASLALHGYQLETSTYRAIEAGLYLPQEPARFLEALAEYLELGDTEVIGLTWRLAYEILCIELGEEIAHELYLDAAPPIPPQLPQDPIQSGDTHATPCASMSSNDAGMSASSRQPALRGDRICISRKYAELRHRRRTRLTNAIGPGRA